ncbi:MAG: DUF4190 domain-containing protein [Rhodoglobus sp.]|nr:DUF4190 domain-containing protein [Rhodoglobus sp.]
MTETATLPIAEPTNTVAETPARAGASDTPVLSILSLVSSITGIVFGMVIPLSIVAIVLGILALSREPRGRMLAIWGIIVGALPGALAILGLVLAAAFFIPLGAFAVFFGG